MVIRKLRVVNVKRLKDATFVPPEDAWLVVVAGNNSAGKSSAMDSICMVLGGSTFDPPDPIRHGEERAIGEVDLGDLLVKCVWTKKGRLLKVIERASGTEPIASPQKFLDRIVGPLSFDPLEFVRKTPSEQAKTLADLLGIDFAEADAARATAVSERTTCQRDKAIAQRKVSDLGKNDVVKNLGLVEISATELLAEVERARQANWIRIGLEKNWLDAERIVGEADALVADLQRQMEDAIASLRVRETGRDEAKKVFDQTHEFQVAPLEARLQNIEEHNAMAREVQKFKQAEEELLSAAGSFETAQMKIEKIDRWKKKRLSDAPFPLPGIAFAEDGASLTMNGVPLSQCSDSEKLKVGVGIGLKMTREVKVMIIRDGSLLDEDSMAEVERMASEAAVQIWVERVGTEGPATWVIEDGEIVDGGASV